MRRLDVVVVLYVAERTLLLVEVEFIVDPVVLLKVLVEEIEEYVKMIEVEKEEEAEKKKAKKMAAQETPSSSS